MPTSSVVSLLASALIVLGWIGFPVAMSVLAARRRRREPASEPASLPSVSVVVATRESPDVVARRVANLRASDYPPLLLEIIVAVDPTAVDPPSAYIPAVDSNVRIVAGDAPGGKAATLNAAVRTARYPVLVFADSHQVFEPGAIRALARSVHAPPFAAASGLLRLGERQRSRSVLDLFWRYELALRRNEAAVHSIPAVTGAIYAMRRDCWTPLPAGLICDDLFVPMRLIRDGYRVGFCEDARAVDPRRFTRVEEFRRKVRTLTGMLQFCRLAPGVLVPRRNPVWLQFVCHKLMRIATPFLLVIAVLGALPALPTLPRHRSLSTTGIGLAVIAAFTALRPRLTRRLLAEVGWSLLFLAAPVVASVNALRGRWDVWGRPSSRDAE